LHPTSFCVTSKSKVDTGYELPSSRRSFSILVLSNFGFSPPAERFFLSLVTKEFSSPELFSDSRMRRSLLQVEFYSAGHFYRLRHNPPAKITVGGVRDPPAKKLCRDKFSPTLPKWRSGCGMGLGEGGWGSRVRSPAAKSIG